MSYLALARKWRPRSFAQLVGQEPTKKALINSLNQQRLHHAYLFTGTRGVGKTSTARLFAKALNCEQGISSESCLQCSACLAIEQGRFIDLIEIDAASKTGIENIREILDNVHYLPTNGRFKVYIVDEVQMLSQHSFNALLKTLEEPPAHVIFILATTDPQKLPITVLSRCLQFHLKDLSIELIQDQLQSILTEEQISFETEALTLLAQAARGSMRDALSLLDQAIVSTNTRVTVNDIKTMLGYTQQDYALSLLSALAQLDTPALIQISRQIAIDGGHFHYVLDSLLNYLHQLTVIQHLPAIHPLLPTSAELKTLAKQFTAEDIQLFYQIGLKGSEDINLAPNLAIGFEMTILRMVTFKPANKVKTPPLAHEQSSLKLKVQNPEISPIVREDGPEVRNDIAEKEKISGDWSMIIPQLKLTGLTLNAAENAELVAKSEQKVTLRAAEAYSSLFTPTIITRLEQALSNYYKASIKVVLITHEPVQSTPAQKKQIAQSLQQKTMMSALENDPFLQQVKQAFSAELHPNSVVAKGDEYTLST